MHRPLIALVALGLGSFALSACNAQFTPYAARVGNETISQATLDSALDSIASDAGYRCVVETTSGGSVNVTGAGNGTYNATFASAALSLLVEAQAVKDRIETMHLRVTKFADEVATNQLPSDFGPPSGSSCTESGAAVFRGLPGRYRNVLLGLQADEDVLAARSVGVPLTKAGMSAYMRHHPSSTTLDCARVIEVASSEKATQLANAIRAGVSFAVVAKKNSLDSFSAPKGGSLGCVLPTALINPLGRILAALPVGRLSTPIAFRSDWLLLEVTRRTPDSLLDVATKAVLPQGIQAATADLASIVAHAKVSIDPTYGSWAKVRSAFQVRPPSGPPLDLVPNPAAVGG